MEILQQFENYIAAQKNVAIQFIIIGVALLLLSALLYFFGKGSISNGLKIGAIGLWMLYLNWRNRLSKHGRKIAKIPNLAL